jgi:DinB family protein
MHPRTTELLRYIDDRTAELRAAFDSVPADRRTVRPGPNRWSAAEVVHHVTIVEQRLTPRIRALIEEAKHFGPERDESSILAIIRPQRAESRERRIQTAEALEPRDTSVLTLWHDFDAARRELTDAVLAGDGLSLSKVSAPHPALGPLTGYDWIAFIGSHAARHAAQIREDVVES